MDLSGNPFHLSSFEVKLNKHMGRITFLLVSFFSHIVGYVGGWYISEFLLHVSDPSGTNIGAKIFYAILMLLLSFSISTAGIAFYFHKTAENSYVSRMTEKDRFQYLVRLLLPAEIIRFLVSVYTLGNISSTGILSSIPSYTYQITYLMWSGRFYAVRYDGAFSFLDFFVYIVFYLLYFILYFIVLQLLHRKFWIREEQLHQAYFPRPKDNNE